MGLVEYSDSEPDNEEQTPPTKKRKVSGSDGAELPSLPAAFHDLYSSTARTSTRDDPSLHGGRVRVTPHVEGNWPTHVYLEGHPNQEELSILSDLVASQSTSQHGKSDTRIHSLLQNELGVSLPLHISLSRPLVLRTEEKDDFLAQLKQSLSSASIRAFTTHMRDVIWHPNEINSRWFMVLRLRQPPKRELQLLLDACNAVAKTFEQPLLYQESSGEGTRPQTAEEPDHFHISIAWSLKPRAEDATSNHEYAEGTDRAVLQTALGLSIAFSEVKVRIGQDVTAIPLLPRRSSSGVVPQA